MSFEFEFIYNDSWYKYSSGWILKQDDRGKYDFCCPVLATLKPMLEDLTADQLRTIMGAIVHGYIQGKQDGKKEKIQEFKRVFDLN